MSDKASTTLPGTVEKIISSPNPREPDKAQIGVDGYTQSEARAFYCRWMDRALTHHLDRAISELF
jgi:hypothetical protein